MKIIYIFAILLASFCHAVAQGTGVKIEVALEQDQYLPSEEVLAGVRIINHSGQTLNLGKEVNWLKLTVQRKNNYIVSKLEEPDIVGEFSLESSTVGTKKINLTPCFNFQEPGRYFVTANVKIPGWEKDVISPPKSFEIINATKLKEWDFGVPSATGKAPEVRKYALQQAVFSKQLKLYFRLSDESGSKALKVFSIGSMVSFAQPEGQVDKESNLHVIHQYGARNFTYCMINPDGEMLVRQTYAFGAGKPKLDVDDSGKISVVNGERCISSTDIPAKSVTATP